MTIAQTKKIALVRVAFWIGIVLDALAFVQMAFPALGRAMLGVTAARTPEYIFAINLGAGLMLAWTLLLFWADRKPAERFMILPLTMIVIAWNMATMVYGVRSGLIPAASMLPQLVLVGAAFFYYGFCTLLMLKKGRTGEGERDVA